MKNLLFILSICALCGCASNAKLIHEMVQSNAAGHFEIHSIYVTLIYDRAMPGTNSLTVGKDGITTK